jgi:uncharacterized protein (TIGR00725 family)
VTRARIIAVIGPGDTDDEGLLVAAEQIGEAVALAGHQLVTGGLGGVMAAASRGAKSAGGVVIGLLPGRDAEEANASVDVALPTGLGEGRNLLVARSASVVVAVGGSWGTLSEIALARRAGTPVVSVRGWRLPDAPDTGGFTEVDSAEQAIRAVARLLSARPS